MHVLEYVKVYDEMRMKRNNLKLKSDDTFNN